MVGVYPVGEAKRDEPAGDVQDLQILETAGERRHQFPEALEC
jgi:hypothetical protein